MITEFKFTVLPVNEMKIIKRINLISTNNDAIGYILYERATSDEYKFSAIGEKVNLFESYPPQDKYPVDEVDKVLLQLVKNSYPNSTVYNDFLFSTLDVEHLNRLKGRPHEQATIQIRPDFSGQDIQSLIGQTFTAKSKTMNIYVEGSIQNIKDIFLLGECNFDNHLEIYNLLDTVKFH